MDIDIILWIIAGALLLVIILLIAIKWYRAYQNKRAINRLRTYIQKKIKEGMPRDIMIQKLRNAGWREDVITNEMLAAGQELRRH